VTSHHVDEYLEFEPPAPCHELTAEMSVAFDTDEAWWQALEAEAVAELRGEVAPADVIDAGCFVPRPLDCSDDLEPNIVGDDADLPAA
jgi:hypothetical protein